VNDWHFGAALSVMLMAAILVTMNVFQRVDNKNERGALF
jgi:ABC-type spermidine/putrescine transport system permease subunit I